MRVYTTVTNMPMAVGRSVAVKVSPNLVQMRSTRMDEVLTLYRRIATRPSVKAVGAKSLQDSMGDLAHAWRTAFKSLERPKILELQCY